MEKIWTVLFIVGFLLLAVEFFLFRTWFYKKFGKFSEKDMQLYKKGECIEAELEKRKKSYENLLKRYNDSVAENSVLKDRINDLSVRAATDPLTGLNNRENLFHRLKQEIARLKRSKSYSLLVFFDLNNFKPLNDNFGHELGDKILVKIAETLKRKSRTQDVIFRYGGDEFVVIMPNASLEKAEIIAKRLQSYFRSIKVADLENPGITASIGITDISNEHPEQIISRADQAMYAAKKADPEKKGSFYIIKSAS